MAQDLNGSQLTVLWDPEPDFLRPKKCLRPKNMTTLAVLQFDLLHCQYLLPTDTSEKPTDLMKKWGRTAPSCWWCQTARPRYRAMQRIPNLARGTQWSSRLPSPFSKVQPFKLLRDTRSCFSRSWCKFNDFKFWGTKLFIRKKSGEIRWVKLKQMLFNRYVFSSIHTALLGLSQKQW